MRAQKARLCVSERFGRSRTESLRPFAVVFASMSSNHAVLQSKPESVSLAYCWAQGAGKPGGVMGGGGEMETARGDGVDAAQQGTSNRKLGVLAVPESRMRVLCDVYGIGKSDSQIGVVTKPPVFFLARHRAQRLLENIVGTIPRCAP